MRLPSIAVRAGPVRQRELRFGSQGQNRRKPPGRLLEPVGNGRPRGMAVQGATPDRIRLIGCLHIKEPPVRAALLKQWAAPGVAGRKPLRVGERNARAATQVRTTWRSQQAGWRFSVEGEAKAVRANGAKGGRSRKEKAPAA